MEPSRDESDRRGEPRARHSDRPGPQAGAGAARSVERRTWNGVLIALPATVLLALLGAGLLAVRMTRSLDRLSRATAEVAEGSFGAPLEVERRDEIGQLAHAFNRMAERLREVER